MVPLSSSMTSLTGLGSESRANKSSLMEMLLYTLDKFTNYSLYRGERVVSPIRIKTDTSLAPDLQSVHPDCIVLFHRFIVRQSVEKCLG